MPSLSELLDDILTECGGFGLFQVYLLASVYVSVIGTAWSMMMMAYAGLYPEWNCWFSHNDTLLDMTSGYHNNQSDMNVCSPQNHTNFTCEKFVFDDSMSTVINQWDLICDQNWVSSTITTIQMAGLLVSGFVSGQIADSFGRKPTLLLSILFQILFNAAAAFSISWEMFAVLRFFIGFATGCYFTVFVPYMIEFIPSKWRPITLAIPTFSLSVALFALVAWWLHDWMKLHIANAVVAVPGFILCCFLPESFRWLVSCSKLEKAENVIRRIARMNGSTLRNYDKFSKALENELSCENQSGDRTYTLRHLFYSWKLARITVCHCIAWFSCGYAYYAIAFGIQQLSGNIYLNMALLALVEIPTSVMIFHLSRCLGRKGTTFLFFSIAGISGLVVAVVQISDIELDLQGKLINGFSLTMKLGIASGWAMSQIYVTESYPTVIRNNGYGFVNSLSRVSGMVAPQVIMAGQSVTGLVFFLCGGLMSFSALTTLLLPETRNQILPDTLEDHAETSIVKTISCEPSSKENLDHSERTPLL